MAEQLSGHPEPIGRLGTCLATRSSRCPISLTGSLIMNNTLNSSVIITGTSSGMGQAVAQRFQDEGWHVVAVDVTPSQQASSELFSPVVGDITREGELTSAIDAALDGKAPLRAIINAAGIFPT